VFGWGEFLLSDTVTTKKMREKRKKKNERAYPHQKHVPRVCGWGSAECDQGKGPVIGDVSVAMDVEDERKAA
jgi:hypothetical protein